MLFIEKWLCDQQLSESRHDVLPVLNNSVNRLTARIRISCSDLILFWVKIKMKWDFFSVRWDRMRFFFCEMRQNQIFFWWDETESDLFSVRWDRIRFIFHEMRQNWILILWNETESDSFLMKWNRIRFLFDEMRQNRSCLAQNETEFSDSDLHKNSIVHKKW